MWQIRFDVGNTDAFSDGFDLDVSVSDLDTSDDNLMVTADISDRAVVSAAGISVLHNVPGSRTIHIEASAVKSLGDAVLTITVTEP